MNWFPGKNSAGSDAELDPCRDVLRQLGAEGHYVVWGNETCPTTGRPHIEGYVHFKHARSHKSVCGLLSGAHVEAAKGTPVEARAYCVGPYDKGDKHKDYNPSHEEYNDLPVQGKRTDIEDVRNQLRNGATMRDITDGSFNYQDILIAEKWFKYNEQKRSKPMEIRWYYGPPGAGKTRAALEWLGDDVYTASRTTSKFWDGYDAHQGVLIDDFRTDWCKFVELLGITDRYAYQVEVKGSARQLRATKMAITCPYSPEEVFSRISEDLDQLLGRLSEIHEITGIKSRRPMPKRFKDGEIQIPPAETLSNSGLEPQNGLYPEEQAEPLLPRTPFQESECNGCCERRDNCGEGSRCTRCHRAHCVQGLQELSGVSRRSPQAESVETHRRQSLAHGSISADYLSKWECWSDEHSLCDDESGEEDVYSFEGFNAHSGPTGTSGLPMEWCESV